LLFAIQNAFNQKETAMTSNVFDTGVHELRRNWGWLLALGIVLIFLGVIALIDSVAVSVISAIIFGGVLIFAGVVEAVQAFRHRTGSHCFLHVLDTAVSVHRVGIMLCETHWRICW
jgi:uncharacterized membrane protein HdeD (DUF308 family)